ncbi:hypothetical protein [Trinickia acidisoli]|uniref:hypothetical protein n=1 Tax=Trinickia acidisoli TaxID=2767482 RepID=UPI001A8BFAAD|nr:hypothetical protein [Trinickia acidisoli]
MTHKRDYLTLHRNAEKIMTYLREHQPSTVATIARSGIITSRAATDAIQYAMRCGAITRELSPHARYCERFQYRLTGQSLCPEPRGKETIEPSFDALLGAWGIAPTKKIASTTLPSRTIIVE